MNSGIPLCPYCKDTLQIVQKVEQYWDIEKVTIGKNGGISFDLGELDESFDDGEAQFFCNEHGIIETKAVVVK